MPPGFARWTAEGGCPHIKPGSKEGFRVGGFQELAAGVEVCLKREASFLIRIWRRR
jgi:hypothetical protein